MIIYIIISSTVRNAGGILTILLTFPAAPSSLHQLGVSCFFLACFLSFEVNNFYHSFLCYSSAIDHVRKESLFMDFDYEATLLSWHQPLWLHLFMITRCRRKTADFGQIIASRSLYHDIEIDNIETELTDILVTLELTWLHSVGKNGCTPEQAKSGFHFGRRDLVVKAIEFKVCLLGQNKNKLQIFVSLLCFLCNDLRLQVSG